MKFLSAQPEFPQLCICFRNETWKLIVDMFSIFINVKDGNGMTPLHQVFYKAQFNTHTQDIITFADYLLEKCADISVVDNNDVSILHTAAQTTNIELVRFAIRRGCPVNLLAKVGFNPLYHLCAFGGIPVNKCHTTLLPLLHVLISSGTDVNNRAIDGTTPLHRYAEDSDENVCEFLVKHGADVNAADFLLRTPLHEAVNNEHELVIGILTHYGAKVNAQDKYGYTPLHHAAMFSNPVAVRSLLQFGADVSIKCTVNKLSPLHLAAETEEPEIIDILVGAGADVNCVDIYGATPLHNAASEGIADVTESLLRNGADVNGVDQL